MNRSYRSVYNDSLGAWVAASEHCVSRGKRSSSFRAGITLLAAIGLCGPIPALAADECGTATAGSTIDCGAGSFGSGISYTVNDLALNVSGGSSVGSAAAALASKGIVNIGSGAGDTTITTTGKVDVFTNANHGNGLFANAAGNGDAFASTSADTTVATQGNKGAAAIAALASGTGNATAINQGKVSTSGAGVDTPGDKNPHGNYGVDALAAGGGDATAGNTGAVSTRGDFGFGVYARAKGGGTATATSNGTIETAGLYATGLGAFTENLDRSGQATAMAIHEAGGVIKTTGSRYGVGVFAEATQWSDAIAVNKGTVSTRGQEAIGVAARTLYQQGDATAVNEGAITTAGFKAEGLRAEVGQGAIGSAMTRNSGSIVTNGSEAAGATANVGNSSGNGSATVEMTGGSVVVTGRDSRGLVASNGALGAATVSMTGGKVMTTNANSLGTYALVGNAANKAAATVAVSGAGSSIATSGDRSHGIYAKTLGSGLSRITMSEGVVRASGPGADGLRAESSSGNFAVDVSGGSVSVSGAGGAGIHTVAPAGGTIDIAAGARVTGTSGLALRDGDTAMLRGIGGTGTIGSGVNAGTDIVGGNVIVTTAGNVTGEAILGLGDDRMNLIGGSFTGNIFGDDQNASAKDGNDTFAWTGGTLSGGFYGHNGSDTALISSASYDGTNVLDGGDDVSAADGAVDRLTLQGVNVAAGGAQLRNWERIDLDNAHLTLAGDPLVVGAGTDASGNALGLNIQPSAGVLMGANSRNFAITGDVHNAGLIDLRSPTGSASAPGNVLAIQGNYAGNDGLVKLNTALGDDSSATDKLQVQGNTSGKTRLLVANAGGNGAATVNGIQVVQVQGNSSAGDFALAAPVQAGAYEYLLQRGGATDGDAHSFYLSSRYDAPPVPPVVEPEVIPPVPPVTPTPAVPEVATVKPAGPQQPQVLRPAVAGYVLGQAASLELGQGLLGTLHQRVGEQQTLKWDYCGCDAKAPDDQAWVRLNAQRLDLDGQRQFGYRQDLQYVQLGKDLSVRYSENAGDRSRTHTGLSAGYGRTGVDFNDRRRGAAGLGEATGQMTGQMATLGAYHTRYADNGSYLDLVGQVHAVRNAYQDKYGGEGTQKGYGGGLSAEVGRPWQIGQSQWLVEPQAQLSYQATRYGQFEDNVSRIDGQTAQSLRGRIGARLAWNDKADRADALTRTNTVYMTANLLHEFKDQSSATIGGTRVSEQWGQQTWAEVGVGAQLPLTRASYLYGGAQYQQSITGASRQGVSGQVGLRVAFE